MPRGLARIISLQTLGKYYKIQWIPSTLESFFIHRIQVIPDTQYFFIIQYTFLNVQYINYYITVDYRFHLLRNSLFILIFIINIIMKIFVSFHISNSKKTPKKKNPSKRILQNYCQPQFIIQSTNVDTKH